MKCLEEMVEIKEKKVIVFLPSSHLGFSHSTFQFTSATLTEIQQQQKHSQRAPLLCLT